MPAEAAIETITFGCRLNTLESELMRRHAEAAGLRDTVIVHTCAVTAEAAAASGLKAGTPVVAGAGDNAAAAIGAGIVEVGQGAVSLGTSGTIFLRGERPVLDPEGSLNAFCDAAGGWHLMGVILAAGGALRLADAPPNGLEVSG